MELSPPSTLSFYAAYSFGVETFHFSHDLMLKPGFALFSAGGVPRRNLLMSQL